MLSWICLSQITYQTSGSLLLAVFDQIHGVRADPAETAAEWPLFVCRPAQTLIVQGLAVVFLLVVPQYEKWTGEEPGVADLKLAYGRMLSLLPQMAD